MMSLPSQCYDYVNPNSDSVMLNVDDLEGAVNTLKLEENVGLAKFNFRVSNKWISGAHNRSTIGDFYGFGKENSRKAPFVLDSDEPPLLLGEDKGPDPVELVLNGLATCLTISTTKG